MWLMLVLLLRALWGLGCVLRMRITRVGQLGRLPGTWLLLGRRWRLRRPVIRVSVLVDGSLPVMLLLLLVVLLPGMGLGVVWWPVPVGSPHSSLGM